MADEGDAVVGDSMVSSNSLTLNSDFKEDDETGDKNVNQQKTPKTDRVRMTQNIRDCDRVFVARTIVANTVTVGGSAPSSSGGSSLKSLQAKAQMAENFSSDGVEQNITKSTNIVAVDNVISENIHIGVDASTKVKEHKSILARNPDKYYRMDSNPRGFCLIINNETFEGTGEKRNGSQRDLDNVEVSMDELAESFRPDQCPNLNQKPKIFIIQACMGDTLQTGIQAGGIEGDVTLEKAGTQETSSTTKASTTKASTTKASTVSTSVSNYVDFLFCFATVPGFQALRNTELGTWFLQTLADVLEERSHSDDLGMMLTEVNDIMSEKKSAGSKNEVLVQTPEYRNSLTKGVFFKPLKQSHSSKDTA